MFCRFNSFKLQRIAGKSNLLTATPTNTVCARELGQAFTADGAIYRDYEQLKLLKRQGDHNFDIVLKAFHTNYVPSTVDVNYSHISKHIKKQTAEVPLESASDQFIADVQDLYRDFKTKENMFMVYIKQNTDGIKKATKKDERFLAAAGRMFKTLNDYQKKQLATAAGNAYSAKYRAMSAKHAKNQMTIPQFLNPYKPSDSVVAIGDKTLWSQIEKEMKSDAKVAGIVKLQKSGKKERLNEQRKQYGFHKNFNFAARPHILTVKHLIQKNPGVHLTDLLKNLDTYKAKMTQAELKKIEKESETLFGEFKQQNEAASLKAVEAKAWAALKESEVAAYGTKEDLKAFRKERRQKQLTIVKMESGKDFSKFLGKAAKEEQRKMREKNGFHQDLTFRSVPYMLFMARNNLNVTTAPAEFAKLSSSEKSALQKESTKLKAAFIKQNKAAAKSAIAAGDWMALKVGEVKQFGTAANFKDFNHAKKAFELQAMQQYNSV